MTAEVRARRPEDLPLLVDVLAEQQPVSRYPVRWPFPYPLADFVARPGELASWTAEVDGRPVGHVSIHPLPTHVTPGDTDLTALWTGAHGRPAEELAALGSFFVADDHQATGLGRLLHDTAVGWMRRAGRGPCLEVFTGSPRAHGFYTRLGWRDIELVRPAWLPDGEPPVAVMWLPPPLRRP